MGNFQGNKLYQQNQMIKCLKKDAQQSLLTQDDRTVAPYAVNGNKWFGFDDEYSIRRKSEYIISMGLGGGMLWSVDTDDFNGQCGKAFPLLVAMNEVSILR